MSTEAKFVKEVTVEDPDTHLPVEIAVYKHQNGGMFGIDSSYVDQVLDEEVVCIYDPFANMGEPEDLYLTD